ncbi:hypothetical protein ABMZ67_10025 [Pseudomonas aeruginosa]|uniref:hypothetical protein n=1 Tax=Pseudomonas TaxID=286 RepID=UPI000450BECF|nr:MULTISPECIES: hypothetical protein [Pseudomonas]EJB8384319.1 hypothetical protein [Pseudomonas aeruginosa]EJO5052868.1 hypothetical protein [Pseudomonas aeruginosa]ELM7153160.1 hypothetical protein [Pseudomonas aeruginosa]ELY3884373.1 hypothetical protein [Pseudomonas aeruginosa]EMB2839187.1 hypothetical protein [Pseudomonas aeruginosa]
MKTFALSNKAFNSVGEVKPSLETSLEQLRRFKEADTNLQQVCVQRGIETPKLVAQAK